VFNHIRDAFRAYPQTTAVFNCTGIGALTLGGVEDKKIFSARVRIVHFNVLLVRRLRAHYITCQQGQIVLVEGPEKPIRKMYFRAPHRDGEATHIFPRGERGGVILGGCRQKGRWDGEPEMDFAKVMKQRCCALVPELGRPEDLKVIKHGVGLRRTCRAQDQSLRGVS